VMDHFYQIGGIGPETEPMLEAYTALAGLAARTSRVKLGTLVTGVTYRNPALVVKMVTTLDVISRGRAVLGIGAAWNDSEHRGYGFEFPPLGERMNRLDEALQIARLMFAEERPSFDGRFYRLERAINHPSPVQKGGPKILVGGGGERRTLRLAARYANFTHWFPSTPADFKRKLEVLAGHCEAEGRDPATITNLVGAPVTLVGGEGEVESMRQRVAPERLASAPPATPQRAADVLAEWMAAGAQGFTFNNVNLHNPELLQLAGEVRQSLNVFSTVG
jgi:F420-dependent oxidoreductase-like protein